ncbi:2OG-Fe(II) oxygenase superfamily [Musa troglodytarum]|uniref:2OG-Fe(II) oxygenase superfamily n=1 Tax=Musa troglodytarum TaxID=320322 RepID=A0A9E7FRE5_9LILI|nr:2OG-Fe(II) oxygenase superfamily [Musa troglodytarum]
MVLESLGVAEHHEELSASTWYLLRFSKYGAVGDCEEEDGERKKAGYMAHRDVNTLAIVCQLNGVDGLEVDSGDGEWIPAKPGSPTSYFVIAGDAFRAWSDGRATAPLHRGNVDGEDTRYSVILFSVPKDEAVIQAPAELVDDRRPSLFRPFAFGGFLRFCVTEAGMKAKCKLSAYCGRAPAAEA